MIRPFTCLCLAAACGSGLYLYSEKHRTAMLDRQISAVIHATEAARARTGLLRAEWALLNEPDRLKDMADKYLTLQPMAPTQFVALADLPNRLPAPEAANLAATDGDGSDAPASDIKAPDEKTADGDAGDVHVGASAPSLAPSLAPSSALPVAVDPAPGAAAPDVTAEAAPPVVSIRRVAETKTDAKPKMLAKADLKPKPTTHHVAASDRAYTPPRDGMMARGTPLPLAAPQPVAASVYSAMARPISPPAYRPPSYHTPAYRPPVVSAVPQYVSPYSSALGGRPSLPPPTPYGGEQ